MASGSPLSRARSQSRDRSLDEASYPMQTLHERDVLGNRADEPDTLLSLPHQSLPGSRNLSRPLRAGVAAAFRWIEGPHPPRPFTITPLFGSIQARPLELLSRLGPRWCRWLILSFYIASAIAFVLILNKSTYGCEVTGFGKPKRVSCISRFWPDANICGVDGEHCRPFHNESRAFRCPANCECTKIWNPRFIGNEEINYRPLVVGGRMPDDDGPAVYRGDSFICGAARHAGLISNTYGGVGVVSLIGEHHAYPAVGANGISSIGFEPSFPLSFTFQEASQASGPSSSCQDPRWLLLTLTASVTSILSIFIVSSAGFFWMNFVSVFFCVALATNPPDYEDYYEVVSSAFGRFLPAAFIAFVIYRYCARRTLEGCAAQFEKPILWLGACWVGALNNFTFDRLPIQRLTPHDLRSQPGAISALVVIILVILVIAFGQVWAFRIEGRLPQYLAFYALVAAGLLVLIAMPGLNLRIHHYIFALLLLPGTALQTRPSLVYQGLLVGLFINGVARWGFASILETPSSLLADGPLGSLVPQVAAPIISGDRITFSWANLTQVVDGVKKLRGGFDSISVLVNDVERFRGFEDHNADSFTWTRNIPDEIAFFRLAFVKFGQIGRDVVYDYTKPGAWFGNGTWSHFAP